MIFLPSARYVAACEVLARSSLVLASLASPVANAETSNSLLDDSTLNMRIESEWAVLTKDASTQKLQLMIEPELETEIGEDASVTTIIRLRTDAKDNLSQIGRASCRERVSSPV